ncbi:tRNA pseudouridine synthase 1 [Nowakowskiella sp. JEL0078]|nr:tRNA pseudouridine synthase 1 [Nowakowskiella sp. JEL0078]
MSEVCEELGNNLKRKDDVETVSPTEKEIVAESNKTKKLKTSQQKKKKIPDFLKKNREPPSDGSSWFTPKPVREGEENSEKEDRLPKKKVALLLGYCGTGYQGMQINPLANTIESELHKAFAASGAVSKDNANDPHKIQFMRAARTDKGVHAAGQVVSLKMIIEDPLIVNKINDSLPEQIRVWGYVRVPKGFHAKNHCDSRIYEYLLPTYTLLPPKCPHFFPHSTLSRSVDSSLKILSDPEKKDFGFNDVKPATVEEMIEMRKTRISPEILEKLREFMNKYVGTHNYHNFTVGKSPNDKNAKRHIKKWEISDPFVRGDMEWVSCKVLGQSFMLHQIRKMIGCFELVKFLIQKINVLGLAIVALRVGCSPEIVNIAFENTKINIPKAPGLGLLLEQAYCISKI